VKVEMAFHTLLSTGIRIVNKDCRRKKKEGGKKKERKKCGKNVKSYGLQVTKRYLSHGNILK
jgi:hypothetical protein